MRNFLAGCFFAAVLATVGVVVAATMSQPNLQKLDAGSFSAAANRPCIHPTGGWTEVDCSAGAAYSAVLNQWSRYIVQANGGDAYFAVTTAGSGQDADSSDGYLPEGSWYGPFVSDGTPRYISCDGSAASATVRYLECK